MNPEYIRWFIMEWRELATILQKLLRGNGKKVKEVGYNLEWTLKALTKNLNHLSSFLYKFISFFFCNKLLFFHKLFHVLQWRSGHIACSAIGRNAVTAKKDLRLLAICSSLSDSLNGYLGRANVSKWVQSKVVKISNWM